MTHTIKQITAAVLLCLAGLLFFAACKKEVGAKEMQSGKEAPDVSTEVKDALAGGTTNLTVGPGGTTPTEGGSCKVTEGVNKGKTGTYSRDSDGSLWCEGTWGGTECGTTKCTSVLTSPGTPTPRPKLPYNGPVSSR